MTVPETQRSGGATGAGASADPGGRGGSARADLADAGADADREGSADAAALRRLVEECEAFSRCGECGTHVVNLDSHRCSSREPIRTDRETRRERAAGDDRDDEDGVGIFPRSSGNSYAYHELREGEVRCGCGNYAKADRLDVVTRAEAKARGRAPCGNCERLEATGEGGE
jgi:hypothetical protein